MLDIVIIVFAELIEHIGLSLFIPGKALTILVVLCYHLQIRDDIIISSICHYS